VLDRLLQIAVGVAIRTAGKRPQKEGAR